MKFKNLLAQSLVWRSVYYISLLLLNVVISRHLQAAGSGELFYLTNLFAFLHLLFSLTIENALTYFGASDRISAAALFWFTLAWCLLMGLSLYLLRWLYLAGFPFFRDYFFYAITYIIGLTLANCMSALFYVKRNFYLPSLFSSALNVLLCLIIILKGQALDAIIGRLYFWLFLSHGLLLVIAYTGNYREVWKPQFPSGKDIQKLISFSLMALAANVIFFLVYRIDYWFVKNSPVCNSADLGNYIQASKLGQMLLIIPQIIASVIFPQTASGVDRELVNNTVTIISRLMSQGFLLLLLILLIIGRWLFPFVFGESFALMYWPMVLLIPGIFSLSVLSLLSAYFSGKGKMRVNIGGALLSLIVVATGDYFFIPVYGIVAAALVSTIGYSAGMLYSLYCFYKDYRINLSGFFRWRITDYRWLLEVVYKKEK